MKIAVVILNWNGRKLLEQFLPSVVRYSDQADLYIADNASTDDSIAYINKTYPDIKIVANPANGGYAKGYNDALEHIDADVYCLLNSDVEVTENWLKPIIEEFTKYPEIAIIQPKLLDYKNKEYFEYAGAAGGFLDKYGYPFCRGRIFDTLEKDENQYKKGQIFWASGACLFIRKQRFKEIGGFDEDFFAHQEEIDLCWRIQKEGGIVYYCSDSTVYHLGGATLNAMNPQKTFLNFRNGLLLLLKNVEGSKVVIILFMRMILDGIAGIKFLFDRKPSHFMAILRAHGSFYANIPKFVKKRTNKRLQRKYYATSSVVWQYYILRKKTFKNVIKRNN